MASVNPTPASAANLFEALFGLQRAPPPAQRSIDAPPAKRRADADRARRKKARQARAESAQPRRPSVPPRTLSGPLGPFLLDPTLRRGDVVVTSEGLKVFTGAVGGAHSPRDFAALSRASQLTAGKAPVLAAIDRANRAGAKPLVEVHAVPVQRATPQPALVNAAPGRQASAATALR